MKQFFQKLRERIVAILARPELEELGRVQRQAMRNLEAAMQWREVALHDALTGLPNRAAVEHVFGTLCERAERANRPLGVLVVDVNGLKQINDELGHDAGDLLIRSVGDVLHTPLRAYDIVFRWGGDEFLVVLQNVDVDQLKVIGERMAEYASSTELKVRGRMFPLSLAIGGVSGRSGLTPEALFRQADLAQQVAKIMSKAKVSDIRPVPVIRPFRPDT